MSASPRGRLPVDNESQSGAREVTVLLLDDPIPHLRSYLASLVGALHTTNHGSDGQAQPHRERRPALSRRTWGTADNISRLRTALLWLAGPRDLTKGWAAQRAC